MALHAHPPPPLPTGPVPNLQAPDLNIILMCKECRVMPPNIVESFSTGDLVCGDCGLVLGDRIIDTRSEWRTFADDEGDDPSRVGSAANPLLNGAQLDTIISKRDGGTRTAGALARAQGRVTAQKGERELVQVYKEISVMADAIGLPKNISDQAKQFYKRVVDEKILKLQKDSTIVVASCIFIACRNSNVPRTFKEICHLAKLPKKEVGRCFKTLAKVLGTDSIVTTMSASAKDLLSRYCSNLNLPMSVQRCAEVLTELAKDRPRLSGKSPISIAGACIYMASHLMGHPTTPKEISSVAGVTDSTIRAAYKYLYLEKERIMMAERKRFPGEKIHKPPAPAGST